MLVNFKRFKKDAYGNIEAPEMILETLHDEIICTVDNYFDLQLELRLVEESTVRFKVPAYDNGVKTACYDKLCAMRKIDIAPFGIYILDEPKTIGDGQKEYKEFSGQSAESLLNNRNIVLEQGTYRFYLADDLASDSPVTIIGIIHSIMPGWSFSVDESLWSKYRTFDETDTGVMEWLSNTAAKSFGCLFNFDVSTKTVYVIDVNAEYDIMDVYLSYDNLIKSGSRVEYTKEMLTVLDVYGADPVNIREVNPIGSNKIYNLDYFIENGDIYGSLADKWRAWQAEVALEQDHYTALQLMRGSAIAHYTTASAKLRDINAELQDVGNRIDTNTKALAMAADENVKASLMAEYESLVLEKREKELAVSRQQADLAAIQEEIDSHGESISGIKNRLSLTSYFSSSEIDILRNYFLEDDFSDSTFATFDVDVSASDDRYESAKQCTLSIAPYNEDDIVDIDLSLVDPGNIINKKIVRLNGGSLTIHIGDTILQALIISGTFERDNTTGETVCSIYTGKGTMEKDSVISEFPNANISIVGECASFESASDFLTNAVISECSFYFTKNTTAFETYSVQQQLYDYAVEQHRAIAYPCCQFDISSGNILFAEEFDAFKDKLQLGRGVYLVFDDDTALTPVLTEIHFSFEDATSFDLIFSNKYRRHDNVQNMKDLLAESKRSARTLEMEKYNYGAYSKTGAESEVKTLFQNGLKAAVTQIVAGKNNSVLIDGSGIKVSDSDDTTSYIKINNGMIALIDDSDQARLAIGKFYDTGMGQVMYGVVAPNVVGTLLAGEYLQIQSPKFDGTNMYFSVDGSGVRLANGQFDLYKLSSNNGLTASDKTISLNPDLGIIVGNLQRAIAYDEHGAITGVNIAESAGSSTNVGTAMSIAEAKANYTNAIANLTPNFWVDLNGDVFMRGTVYATDGVFSGKVYATDGEFTGTVHATDGDFTGTIHATDGEFSGTLKAPTLSGTITADGTTGGAIKGVTLGIGGTDYNNFTVDSNGNVVMNGNITLGGNITWSSTNKLEADVTYESVVGALKTSSTADGIYAKDGKIHVNASMIDAGSISASRISAGTLDAGAMSTTGVFTFKSGSTTYGKIGQHSGSTGTQGQITTYGTAMYGKDDKFYVFASDYGVRMSNASNTNAVFVDADYAVIEAGSAKVRAQNTDEVWIFGNKIVLYGNSVVLKDNTAVTSDRRTKNSISYDVSRYEDFFENLKPAYYRVNHGSSGRFHLGLVANDVKQALETAGLTTSDFAGYVEYDESDDDGKPTGNTICALRYGEFISLNTFMIQKLMARIDELEHQIDVLSGGNK